MVIGDLKLEWPIFGGSRNKGYQQTKQPLPVLRFVEIMEELRRISGQYGVDTSAIRTARLSYPLSNAYYVFMKEVLSQDTPVWGDEDEIGRKIEEILALLRQITVGVMPYVGDAIDLFELIMGADWFTGQELTSEERTLSAFALLAGSGKMWREVALGVDETLDSAKLAGRMGKGSVKRAKKALNEAEDIGNSVSNWTYHTPINPGPLPNKVTETFRSGSYVKRNTFRTCYIVSGV